jgi:hypothetical protein
MLGGKKSMTEAEIYAAIKSYEKKLKYVDQLLNYQTIFISQVVIPNFNLNRQKLAEQFVKGVICKNYLKLIQKDKDIWD